MATLGINDLKQYALPTYWDAAKLAQMNLEAGYTYERWLTDVATGLAMANAALLADPLIAGLISITTDAALEYRVGVSNGFQDHTEYSVPDQKRGKTTGHMLPLKPYDRGMGWTWDFLRQARRVQLDADVASAMEDLRNIWAQKILTRFFKSDYDAVGSGRSMPLADGGTADATYVPTHMPDRGGTFLYTHDHVTEHNGITQAFLETEAENLWEHGHNAPFDLLVAEADISSWTNTTNVTGYVPRASALVRYGLTADLANVGEDYIGAVDTNYGACRLRATGRLPTTYWGLYKSYGNLDQRNPLRVRYNPAFGIGCVLLAGDNIRTYPFEKAILFMEFGVGVTDRVGGIACMNTAGSFSTPTIA